MRIRLIIPTLSRLPFPFVIVVIVVIRIAVVIVVLLLFGCACLILRRGRRHRTFPDKGLKTCPGLIRFGLLCFFFLRGVRGGRSGSVRIGSIGSIRIGIVVVMILIVGILKGGAILFAEFG